MKKRFTMVVALMVAMFSLSFASLAADEKKAEKDPAKVEQAQPEIKGVKLILPNKKELISVPAIVTEEVFITTTPEAMQELVKILAENPEKEFNKKFEELAKDNKAGVIKKGARVFIAGENAVAVECYLQELEFPIYILKYFVKYQEMTPEEIKKNK